MSSLGGEADRVARREKVGELHLKGFSLIDIAQTLGASRRTVTRDLELALDEWRSARAEAVERAQVVELAALRLLEREAWDGWRRSQEQGVSEKLSKTEQEKLARPSASGSGPAGETAKKLAERTSRTQYGDPRFLMLIMRCVERRARLLEGESPSDEFVRGSRITVSEVLDQVSQDADFLDYCRTRAAQQFADVALDAPPEESAEAESGKVEKSKR